MNDHQSKQLPFACTIAAAFLGGWLLISAPTSQAAVLYSCPGTGIGGDLNTRGFYMTNFPAVTLDSATLKLIGPFAGTYQVTLTAYSNAYYGPILGASTVTVTLNDLSGAFVSTKFPFADVPMPHGGTV